MVHLALYHSWNSPQGNAKKVHSRDINFHFRERAKMVGPWKTQLGDIILCQLRANSRYKISILIYFYNKIEIFIKFANFKNVRLFILKKSMIKNKIKRKNV